MQINKNSLIKKAISCNCFRHNHWIWSLLIIYYFLFTLLFSILTILSSIALIILLTSENIIILEFLIINFNNIFEIKFYFIFDYVSNLFILIVRTITIATFNFRKYYIENDKNKNKFLLLTFLFVISMYLVILRINIFTILVGWDGLGITSYLLVIHYKTNIRNYSGIITIITNRLGDVGLLLALYFILDNRNLDINLISKITRNILYLYVIFIIFRALTKRAQFPFSSWLPLAIAAPTPVSALVHSSTLVTAGVYLFIRFNFLFKNNYNLTLNLIVITIITRFIASINAIREIDIKKIIAFSTLSQLGLIIIITLAGNITISFFHILTHALFKALLFLCSGILIHENIDNQDIRNYCFIIKFNKLISSTIIIRRLSLIGIPFLRGFYSKELIIEIIYSLNYNLFFTLILMSLVIITTIYSLRLIYFRLNIRKIGNLINFSKKWDKIYNSLFIILLGVLTSGRILNWTLIEKLNNFNFNYTTKNLNLILIYWRTIFYPIINIKIKSKFTRYFQQIFYLTNIQGYWINSTILKSYWIYYCNEYILENLFIYKLNKFINKNIILIKYFNYFFYLNIILIIIIISILFS